MHKFNPQVRDTFLAGVFAGVPIIITVVIVRWIDQQTQILAEPIFHRQIPLLGVVFALISIYLLGLVVRSFLGRQILRLIDTILTRMPVVKPVYEAWKQVSLTPGGKEGMYSKVVMIRSELPNLSMVGFTSGEAIPGNPELCVVFVPNSPNPITGRLYFVPRSDIIFLDMPAEEGLKLIVSNGNYLPAGLR